MAICFTIPAQPNSPFSLTPCSTLLQPSSFQSSSLPHYGNTSSRNVWQHISRFLGHTTAILKYFDLPLTLIKIKLLLPQEGGTREESEVSTPALSPSPGRWLSLGCHPSSQLGGKCSCPDPNQAQLGHGTWLAAGLGGQGRCSRCADW